MNTVANTGVFCLLHTKDQVTKTCSCTHNQLEPVFTVRPRLLLEVLGRGTPQVVFHYHISDLFYDLVRIAKYVLSKGRMMGQVRTGQGLVEVVVA